MVSRCCTGPSRTCIRTTGDSPSARWGSSRTGSLEMIPEAIFRGSRLVSEHAAAREHMDGNRRDIVPWRLLDDLRCAYCSGPLVPIIRLNQTAEGLTDGILKCECCEYPVVGGIAVLRQIGSVSSTRNEAVERLKRND